MPNMKYYDIHNSKGILTSQWLTEDEVKEQEKLGFRVYLNQIHNRGTTLQPSVDVVKVVRCKDCKQYSSTKTNRKGFRICPASSMEITPDDFCSYGERKEIDND